MAREGLEGLLGRESTADVIAMATKLLPNAAAARKASAPKLRLRLRRRAVVVGSDTQVIPFHRDHSLVVANVALNDGFTGGNLVFALGGRIVQPVRHTGDATAHNCAAVHAVTGLVAGVRYNLFATFEDAAHV
eukprot:6224976-Prymnesium_polylepis.1